MEEEKREEERRGKRKKGERRKMREDFMGSNAWEQCSLEIGLSTR